MIKLYYEYETFIFIFLSKGFLIFLDICDSVYFFLELKFGCCFYVLMIVLVIFYGFYLKLIFFRFNFFRCWCFSFLLMYVLIENI